MNPRYTEPITLKEARSFVKTNFGDSTRISWGARCLWVAGLQYISDQPGLYLVSGAGGLSGVQVIENVQTMEAKAG